MPIALAPGFFELNVYHDLGMLSFVGFLALVTIVALIVGIIRFSRMSRPAPHVKERRTYWNVYILSLVFLAVMMLVLCLWLLWLDALINSESASEVSLFQMIVFPAGLYMLCALVSGVLLFYSRTKMYKLARSIETP